MTPARRRASSPVPVLIRVPMLAGGPGRPAGRRRLRREVRVAGCWLLALIPAVSACATWGGHRPAVLLAVHAPERAAARSSAGPATPTISLSLEPAVAAQPAPEAGGPVFLSGQLLPADPAEEPPHGGY